MSTANPLWGAPRIHGELLKLGIQISQATVAKYMVRQRKPPPQTWRTFLENHVQQLVAIDFLVVPTVSFRLLFVFVALGHHRRVSWWKYRKWAGCIIAMSEEPPKSAHGSRPLSQYNLRAWTVGLVPRLCLSLFETSSCGSVW
jgi:hypothetical protein